MTMRVDPASEQWRRRRFLTAFAALGAGALLPACQTAGSSADSGKPGHHEAALEGLLKIIPASQVLYGTDYPFWDGRKVATDLDKGPLSAADRRAIDRDNALRLFPRLKA